MDQGEGISARGVAYIDMDQLHSIERIVNSSGGRYVQVCSV